MNASSTDHGQYVLTLSCPDRPGIVHAVAPYLHHAGGSITDSQQFGDPYSGRFFMRVHTQMIQPCELARLRAGFAAVAEAFGMDWQLNDVAQRHRVLIMVSAQGHCLNDLLFRTETGDLPIDVAAVVSNHATFAGLARWHGIAFHHLPTDPTHRQEAEQRLLKIVAEQNIDLVVLARYMQILSPELCEELAGRAINIHHSFLPSFKGARPYYQAHERGVKLIGATAHYVTSVLDEGPIIEQEIARVDHGHTPERLAAVGRDVECLALARAVRWHVERRVLLNNSRTVVFR
ncbi:MAG: formyltetrahydrofolate deformylase [Mycobacteriales bacterium]